MLHPSENGHSRAANLARLLTESRYNVLLTCSLYSLGTSTRAFIVQSRCRHEAFDRSESFFACVHDRTQLLQFGGFDTSRQTDFAFVVYVFTSFAINLLALLICADDWVASSSPAREGPPLRGADAGAIIMSDLALCYRLNRNYWTSPMKVLRAANEFGFAFMLGCFVFFQGHVDANNIFLLDSNLLFDVAPSALPALLLALIALAHLHAAKPSLAKVSFSTVEDRAARLQWSDLLHSAPGLLGDKFADKVLSALAENADMRTMMDVKQRHLQEMQEAKARAESDKTRTLEELQFVTTVNSELTNKYETLRETASRKFPVADQVAQMPQFQTMINARVQEQKTRSKSPRRGRGHGL